MADAEIHHVSDTALWVAAYRAAESARPDAAFQDPLASRLVGDRGRALREVMPGTELLQWVMVLRTLAIDRLVDRAIELGTDTVINLGAGLDTRPYRMHLPKELRWIEVDFPSIIDLKNRMLSGDLPKCRLERLALDLTDHELRRETLRRVTESSRAVTVITEGVLPYLEESEVTDLARLLHELPAIQYWIQDYYSGSMADSPFRAWREKLKSTPIRFEVPDWFSFFLERGFEVAQNIRLTDQAKSLGRRPPIPFWRALSYLLKPPSVRRRMRDRAGYVLFKSR